MAGDTLLPLSVVVIARNEERRIGDCLRSVGTLADDLIVVDSGSTDATREIAEAAAARVFVRAWPGYSAQKNFGNTAAAYDWILSLDADERVSEQLAESIRREFAHGLRCDVYDVRFTNFYGARTVRFGAWNPEWHARLFDRRVFSWNADSVHEGLRGPDSVRRGRLRGPILHFTVENREQLSAKTERYATLFALKARQRRREPSWAKVWLNPGWRFLRDYVLRFGLLDGAAGLAIAWEAARYTHLKYRRARTSGTTRGLLDWLGVGSVALACVAVLAFAGQRDVHSGARRSPTVMVGSQRASSAGPRASAAATNAQTDDNSTMVLPSDDDVAV